MSKSRGPDDAPVLMLSNSLGTDLHMWEPSDGRNSRSASASCATNSRGHGQSVAGEGPYSIAMLGRDALATHGCAGPASGESGWDCRWAAWSANGSWPTPPDRIEQARSVRTRTDYYADKGPWNGPHQTACARKAWRIVAAGTMERWFTKGFRDAHPARDRALDQTMFLAPPSSTATSAAGEAVRDMDHRALLHQDQGADADHRRHATIAATTLADGANSMRDTHPRRRSSSVLEAAHISNVEQPQAYSPTTVLNFSAQASGPIQWTKRNATNAAWPGAAKVLGHDMGRSRQCQEDRRSTRNSRTSSRATPGASSGRGRTTTSAPAACW